MATAVGRRALLAALAWGYACARPHAAPNSTSAPDARLNVLHIVAHDLRADFDGPNTRALAREGARFALAFSNAPFCAPSRHSFLTGRRPAVTRVHTFVRRDDEARWTSLPRAFRDAGYATATVGFSTGFACTGCWSQPEVAVMRGCHSCPQADHVAARTAGRLITDWARANAGAGAPDGAHGGRRRAAQRAERRWGGGPGGGAAAAAASLVHPEPSALPPAQPWYLLVGFVGGHLPHVVPEAASAAAGQRLRRAIAAATHTRPAGGGAISAEARLRPAGGGAPSPGAPLCRLRPPSGAHAHTVPAPSRQRVWRPGQRLRALRDALAAYAHLDAALGLLLRAARGAPGGVYERRTVVCFHADHGLSVGEYGVPGKKGKLLDVDTRVPLVLRVPPPLPPPTGVPVAPSAAWRGAPRRLTPLAAARGGDGGGTADDGMGWSSGGAGGEGGGRTAAGGLRVPSGGAGGEGGGDGPGRVVWSEVVELVDVYPTLLCAALQGVGSGGAVPRSQSRTAPRAQGARGAWQSAAAADGDGACGGGGAWRRSEPPLAGRSLLPLLLRAQAGAAGGVEGAPAHAAHADGAARAEIAISSTNPRAQIAISTYPRCPMHGGKDWACRRAWDGRIEVMGTSVRTAHWRYVIWAPWVRSGGGEVAAAAGGNRSAASGYAHAPDFGAHAPDFGAHAPDFGAHAPDFGARGCCAEELYFYPAGLYSDESRHSTGGGYRWPALDLAVETANVASAHPQVARALRRVAVASWGRAHALEGGERPRPVPLPPEVTSPAGSAALTPMG